jgi:hypothetical protein
METNQNARNKATTAASEKKAVFGDIAASQLARQNKSRRMRWAGHVALIGTERNAHRVLMGKPEGKRPLGRPRRGWEDEIRMYLKETGWGSVEWIQLAHDRDR